MNKTAVLAIVLALSLGFAGGYVIGDNKSPISNGAHVMPDGATMADQMNDMTTSLQGKTGEAFDKAFIEVMIVHHEGAVNMANLALQHAEHSEVKKLAQDIITAQTSEITMMQGWLQSWFNVGNKN